MRPRGFPHGGYQRILRLVPHDLMYDSTLYGLAVHGIRIDVEGHEPDWPIRSVHPLLRWRNRWWFCSGAHHSTGRYQDTITNTRKCQGRGAEERIRINTSGKDHSSKRRIRRVLSWAEAPHYHHHAQHCHLLVGFPPLTLSCDELI
jgi:hypothetical protein